MENVSLPRHWQNWPGKYCFMKKIQKSSQCQAYSQQKNKKKKRNIKAIYETQKTTIDYIYLVIQGCLYKLPGEGNSTPLWYFCLENLMDGGAWQAAVHGVTKSQTLLSALTFTFHFHALEKEMETHSSVLAWKIPGTGEPGGLPSMGSHRVEHN